jgi:type VI secretion system secreted protein VgrG
LFVHEGGLKVIAQDETVSIQAHTDELNWKAKQDLTITSSQDGIEVLAKEKVTLKGGNTSIVLDGANITLTMPATLDIKGSAKGFVGPGRDAAQLPDLPQGEPDKGTLYLDHRYHDDEGLAGAEYVVKLVGGTERRGVLDSTGKAEIPGLPFVGGTVSFGPAAGAFQRKDKTPTPQHDPNPGEGKLKSTADRYIIGQGPAADSAGDANATDNSPARD